MSPSVPDDFQGAALPPLPSFWTADAAQGLMDLAQEAGARIMQVREGAQLGTRAKTDGTPVTVADTASQEIILAGLRHLTPNIPIVSEEQVNTPDLTRTETYWLVDPLDGTRDFVQGGKGFSVNIGLLVDGEPRLGVLYAPALGDLVYGAPDGVWRRAEGQTARLLPPKPCAMGRPPDILTSQREARKLPIATWQERGIVMNWTILSGAFKFALLAMGRANFYVRTGTTYEWDTAAGDAILRALGGCILTSDGTILRYNKPDYRNGHFIGCANAADGALTPRLFNLMKDA